jgi:hypothetical protein
MAPVAAAFPDLTVVALRKSSVYVDISGRSYGGSRLR